MKHFNSLLLLSFMLICGCANDKTGMPLILKSIEHIEDIMVDDTQINPITCGWVDEKGMNINFYYVYPDLQIIDASEDNNDAVISMDGKTLTGEHVKYSISENNELSITISPCGAEEMHYYDFTLLYRNEEYKYRVSQSSRANQDKLAELLRKNPLKGGHVFD